jgi:hypothetical protein
MNFVGGFAGVAGNLLIIKVNQNSKIIKLPLKVFKYNGFATFNDAHFQSLMFHTLFAFF